MPQPVLLLLDRIEKNISDLDTGIKLRRLGKTRLAYGKLTELSNHLKELLPKDFVDENFNDFDRHMKFINIFLGKKDFEWIASNFIDVKEEDFPTIRKKIYDLIKEERHPEKSISQSSTKIFIVHGKTHEPMKKLKTMLSEFGLNPIVLHEQPSGSRTIVEKLEKYSDVGYAFIILTPDDVGCSKKDYLQLYNVCLTKEGENEEKRKQNMEFFYQNVLQMLINRARQNVILEFGYFIGLLGRDRVCCLLMGDVKRPSDMDGIVYVGFKKSIEEARDMIVKELKEAGYEIKR